MDISPVMIVKDASLTLAQTLESLKEFDEVIVYDTGSQDNTIKIAKNYVNVKLFEEKFEGFGKSKNKAALLAKNDWVLSIDADEVVSPKLMESLRNLEFDKSCVYRIKRCNYYRKKRIRYSGWQNETVLRIYNKSEVCFNEKMVHENIEVGNSKIVTIKGELRHFSYHSISDFIRKRDLYTELFALEKTGKRKSSPLKAFAKGTFDFLNTFIIRGGFLDGYRGLLIAVSNSNVSFFKYLKLYEANINNKKKISLIVVAFNWNEALELTLKSVLNQTIPPDEIVIAEDGLQDETLEMIEKFAKYSFVPVIHSRPENMDFSSAKSKNRAISKATGDYIIFIHGDTILHKSFISNHIEGAKKGYYLQGSRVMLDSVLSQKFINKETNKLPSLFSFRYNNKFNSLYIPILGRLFISKRNKSRYGIQSCNFSFFKEDLIKVNGFNEEFLGMVQEGCELVERLYNSGIFRKNLRFCGIQYHLNHEIEQTNPADEAILRKTIQEKSKRCDKGVDKYLLSEERK